MRTLIAGVFLLLAIVYIGNVESTFIKKHALAYDRADFKLRNLLRDRANSDENTMYEMLLRQLKSYAAKRENENSIFSWDLDKKQQDCVMKCYPVPDDQFEDCYKKCVAA